jgi:hypothetical protein
VSISPHEYHQLATELASAVEKSKNILSDSSFLRRTFESAIAEAQGARFSSVGGRVVEHLNRWRDQSAVLRNHAATIRVILQQVRAADPSTGRELSQAFEPLLDLIRSRTELIRRTENLLEELGKYGYQSRLAGRELIRGGPDWIYSAGNQLRLQGTPLISRGLAAMKWVRDTLAEIRRLPLSKEQAVQQISATLGVVRVTLQAIASRATWTTVGGAILRAIITSPLRILLPIVVTDDEGNPIGFPNSGTGSHRNPWPDGG